MRKIERKINDQELANIKSLTEEINNCKVGITDFEVRKYALVNRLINAENNFYNLQQELVEKYGKVSINITDGSIKEVEENATNP